MNSSATSRIHETPFECELQGIVFLVGRLDSSTTEVYAVLLFITIMNIITCPITTVLNALVMFVVGTKPQLKTNSNVTLGCLATTDGMMGVIGQPLCIVWIMTVLQGEANCIVRQLSASAVRILGTASLLHMALVNVERYIAIKHSFAYITMVNKSRILRSSVIIWIGAIFITIPLTITNFNIYLIVNNIALSLCITIIFYCQVVIYFEIRRHEKEIAAQQVSVEAKQKFLKDKKAFKLTTTVVFILILTYSPIIVVRMLITKSVIDSLNVTYIAFYTAIFVVILNSLLNPVIYCVRLRQFRVAFIEVVFRKSNAQAEEIEMQVFGTLNACDQHEEGQERAEDQNDEQRNSNNTGNNNNNSNDSDNNNNNNNNNSEVNNNHSSNIDDNVINNNSNSNSINNNSEDNNKYNDSNIDDNDINYSSNGNINNDNDNNNAFLNKQVQM